MVDLKEPEFDFLYLLAYLYMQQSKFDMALQLFRILRLLSPKNLKIALALASCLHKARYLDEALKVLHSINENDLDPDQKTALFYINSKVLWDLKQTEASRDMLHKYLKSRNLK